MPSHPPFREQPQLRVVVGLGSIRPSFTMRQRVLENLPWEQALARFPALVASAYSVSLFTDYAGDAISQGWLKALDSDSALTELFGATPAVEARHPLPGISGEKCTAQLDEPGPWLDRLPHFRHEFTPSNGEELQSEYILPLEHGPAAIEAVRSLATSWRRCVCLRARPHWGNLFTPSGHDWEALYPRFADFRAMAAENDPEGKFRNGLLDSILGASAATLR